MLTGLPAYGRTYKNADAIKRDWHEGKDFIETASRRAFNRQDVPGDVVLRYGPNNSKVTSYTAKDTAKLDKIIAAEKAAIPAQSDTFEGWMKKVDAAVIAESGMSYQDLPDIDFYSSFDAGVPPEMAAKEVLEEAGF